MVVKVGTAFARPRSALWPCVMGEQVRGWAKVRANINLVIGTRHCYARALGLLMNSNKLIYQ